MREAIFLFGAGASFGAGSILPERPPLGWQLYDQLAHLYPGSWGALPADITSVFRRGDFESGMGHIYERFGVAIPQLMREMAIYFVQFRPIKQSSLYCRLVRDLDREHLLRRSVFATLNYECVLEFSLLQQGHGIDYFGDDAPEAVPVWKLHGSSNMFAHGVHATQGVHYGTGVVFEGGIQAFLDPGRVIGHCLVETALAPVMSLYMRGKPLAVSPSVIAGLQGRWAATVETAKVVVIVGVRPWPIDTHIWGPLEKAPGQLLFIGDRVALEEWLQTSGRRGRSEHLGERFAAAYAPLIRRLRILCN